MYSWEQRKVGDTCKINGRIGFRGYTEKDIISKEAGGVLTFSPTNIVDNKLTMDCKNTYITRDKYEESPEIMININDVILCKTGSTVGKVAVVDFLPEKATLNPQLVVLKNIRCNHRYLFYQLSKESTQKEIKKLAGIGSVPNISQKAIANISIPIPSLEEQEKIVNMLDRFDIVYNDISMKLSAEIDSRRKQYEYYRDEIMSFEKVGAAI